MRLAAAGLLAVAGLLASCSAVHVRPAAHPRGGTRPAGARAHVQGTAGARLQVSRGPWWSPGGPTPCAPPALVRAAGHVMGVGTCSTEFSIPALRLKLAVGQRIDVHMAIGTVPHSSRPSVLAPVTVSRDGATQTYRADRPGQAVLVSGARGCLIFRHRQPQPVTSRTCPVATVTVVP